MNVVLLSTYEMGRQPFGLASPAAWLRRAGASVTCLDLSREPLQEEVIRAASLIAFYLPMHTATRLAVAALPRLGRLNSSAHLCFYGLYAPVNETFLRGLGAQTILGGEFETGLASLVERLRAGLDGPQVEPVVSLERSRFLVPERQGLPPLSEYARLRLGDGKSRTVGYTEASRGCQHLCRHCPVVPVYQGRFRVVNREVVLEDIRRQVAAGAQHITFGDPDFFNGPGHSMAIVRALHSEFPELSYDVTIKIEHLLKQAAHLSALRATGCLLVTSAVESIDDHVLRLLDKGHTREDVLRALELCRQARLTLVPTFVPFTPWTSQEGYRELLEFLARNDLVHNLAPIQLAIRLLIPSGSRLLELPEVLGLVGAFEPAALSYRWEHPDPRMDELCRQILALVKQAEARRATRAEIFAQIWDLAHQNAPVAFPWEANRLDRAAIPYINEPWYC